MSVHKVNVRMSLGKRMPLGRLQKFLYRLRTVYLVQPMPYMWNVVIVEMLHEQQILPTSTSQGLIAHNIGVGDVAFLILVVFWRRNRDNVTQ
jgi:hypothetical protein